MMNGKKVKEGLMHTLVNGIQLAYEDQGQGESLVFIHAFPLSKAMWKPQVTGLVDRYRIITIDVRGHGESDALLWCYTLDQFADDIHELIGYLGLQQATFIGLSMGGYVLFALYRKYPELFRSLVLSDTRAQADSEEVKAGRVAMVQMAWKEGAGPIANLMLPKLLSPRSLESKKDLVEHIRSLILQNQISGIMSDLMAMAQRPDATSMLAHITCPTLVMVGQDDVATPPSESQYMVDRLPNARFETIPQAGHLSNLEQPEVFNRVLESFLAGLRESESEK